ncbi:outer membrane lipoprotein-sorting protein [Pseudomonas sp. M30-35]|uniref:outer membrane lipoprotein-sorting protein n=1 Tax=Pseudomonas sp. M30-35 TaxID=1981174 RepID=UPI000B3D1540|nr:outer membrane lipoprotein-sorting protein [Pseudomonas sp. M30-35]ARU86485.1 hypothetical protein B9K09_00065 [Pseudomonas sp. M30-35]
MNNRLLQTLLALSLSLAASSQALGQTEASPDAFERGTEIANKIHDNDSGFVDYKAAGYMTTKRAGGAAAERSFQMYTLESADAGDKRLVVFQTPRDLAGFVSLTYNNPDAPDDQWIFLPALNRVKRLASRDKTGSFGGSEFSYEDIATWELNSYTYKFLQDEPCGEPKTTCHTIANIPKYQYSGYSKLVETIDPRIWKPQNVVYFDKAGRELKRLDFYDYQQYQGKYWRPGRIVMTNLRDNSVSEIKWVDYTFKTGLKESDMSERRMAFWSR